MNIAGTIDEIKAGGDRSNWFGVLNKEWSDYIASHAEQYPNVIPSHAYAKKVFNGAFASVVRRNNPDKKIGSLPEYAKVFKWLLNNEQKGLFLIGDCGTGKTAIIEALWRIFAQGCAMWFDNKKQMFVADKKIFVKYVATDLTDYGTLDTALAYRFVMVDDVGTEAETAISYGQRRNPIAEIVDNAEKKNGLLIMTSNLTPSQLMERYGQRTLDRLNALCNIIQFKGESFR